MVACRRWRQAAELVVMDGVTGGKHCRLTTTSAAPRDRHMECRWQNAWWRQVVNSSPRALTPGGRAMEAACRTTLPHQRRQWSLPQLYVCMSACCRRMRSMFHLDGLRLRIRRFHHLYPTAAYPLDAVCELHTMDSMCAREKSALCALFSRDCFCVGR